MTPCDLNLQSLLYVDDELRAGELAAFESHLAACAACRATVAEERRLLDQLHAVRPLYAAPAELRSRVETLLLETPVYTAPETLRARVRKVLEQRRSFRPRWQIFPALVGMAALLIVFAVVLRRPAHSDLATLALNAHTRYTRGELPLQVRSASPETVSGWLNDRMSLHLKLPAYEEMPDLVRPVHLQGGGLLHFRKSSGAYVMYHVRNKPVSLIAVSSSETKPSGGKRVEMKPLTFYYDSIDGYNVITWLSKTGLVTYAMVSDGGERPEQSCIVCHASTSAKDRNLMTRLLQ